MHLHHVVRIPCGAVVLGFPCSAIGKEPAASAGDMTWARSLDSGRSLEEMTTHSIILDSRAPRTEESAGLWSMGL